MNTQKEEECWSISPSDPDLDIYALGIEGYSKLSDECLNTILRSFNEALQQKRSHLNLIENLDCDNKDELIGQTQEGIETLNDDIRCVYSELSSRKTSKDHQGGVWFFPVLDEDESHPDLKIVTELEGPSFDELDKQKFQEQYLSIVHYSRSNPLSTRELQQIFNLK